MEREREREREGGGVGTDFESNKMQLLSYNVCVYVFLLSFNVYPL